MNKKSEVQFFKKIFAFFEEVGRWSANKKSTNTNWLCGLTYEDDKE